MVRRACDPGATIWRRIQSASPERRSKGCTSPGGLGIAKTRGGAWGRHGHRARGRGQGKGRKRRAVIPTTHHRCIGPCRVSLTLAILPRESAVGMPLTCRAPSGHGMRGERVMLLRPRCTCHAPRTDQPPLRDRRRNYPRRRLAACHNDISFLVPKGVPCKLVVTNELLQLSANRQWLPASAVCWLSVTTNRWLF